MMENISTNLIEMVEEERYEWDVVNHPHELPIEAFLQLKHNYAFKDKKRWELIAIRQWLYYPEETYRNWVYNLDQKEGDAKDAVD